MLKHIDPVYLRNRALYFIAQNPPLDDGGGAGDGHEEVLVDSRPQPIRWDTSALPQREPVEGPVEGLFLLRGYFNSDELSLINRFTETAAQLHPHGWYTYHQGRLMMPLQAAPDNQDKYVVEDQLYYGEEMSPKLHALLSSLQSTNNTDPLSWPSISKFAEIHKDPGAILLSRLQTDLSNGLLLPSAKEQPCLFYQVQTVERGGAVGSHVDPLDKGGRCITTLTTTGSGTDIRVADTIFFVEPGDVYGIEGYARYAVEHEVLPSVDDRTTYTLRFGWHTDDLAEKYMMRSDAT